MTIFQDLICSFKESQVQFKVFSGIWLVESIIYLAGQKVKMIEDTFGKKRGSRTLSRISSLMLKVQ